MANPKVYMTFSIFGSRVLFCVLAPVLILCIPVFARQALTCLREGNLPGTLISVILTICCTSGLLIGISIRRFGWTSIFITVSIPAAYIWYFCDTFFVEKQPLTPGAARSETTPWNALIGFVVFGLPCVAASYRTVRGWFRTSPSDKRGISGVEECCDENPA